MNPTKHKDFNRLKREWYRKLSKSGFEDAEFGKGTLKVLHNYLFCKNPEREKTNYYRLAGQLLHTHQFTSRFEMRIWELHSEGKTLSEIATSLRSTKEIVRLRVNEIRKQFVRSDEER